MKLGLLGLRAAAIVLSGSCLCLAAGGVFQNLADIHFEQGDYAKAADLSRQSLHYNRGHFDSLMRLGLSDWKQWLQTKDAKALVRASKTFKTLTRVHSGDAKGWFYKALSEKNVLQLHGTLTESERYRINQEFNRAQALEPYSPWMAVFTALEILENTPADRRVKQDGPLLKRIRWALRQHYSGQASPYLEDVYSRLLTMGYASKVLQQVTPKEARSYFQLLQFYKSNRDYDLYSQVEIRYETLKNKFYSRLCDQADGWLEQGDLRRAEAAYRFAQIQRPWAARAQAGLFASEVKLPIGSPDVLKAVEALLIQEEEDLSFYWTYLASAVKDSRSLFLEGLLDYRQGQYSQAVQALQNAEAAKLKTARRFLAQALIETGRLEFALETLKPLLQEEKPDLRELLLLERLADKESAADIQNKIRKALTLRVSNRAWWSETTGASPLLEAGNFSGVAANLQPGRVQIGILLKLEASSRVRLARVRVWENDREQYSSAVAVTPHWRRTPLDFETTGGWRWIQVTFEKEDVPQKDQPDGPRLWLGSVHMDYPE